MTSPKQALMPVTRNSQSLGRFGLMKMSKDRNPRLTSRVANELFSKAPMTDIQASLSKVA